MKVKKIISLCKSAKTMNLYDDKQCGAQWLSDGYAAYLLEELPKLDNLTTD